MRLGLPISIALHLLLLCFWQLKSGEQGPPATRRGALIVRILTSQESRPAPAENGRPAQTDRVSARVAARHRPGASITARRPEAVTAEHPVSTIGHDKEPPGLPLAALPADDLVEKAKRDVGRIDRELRKDYPQLPQVPPDSVQSRLASGIAAAGKRSWLSAATTEEMLSPNRTGRRMYRINTPAGSYCVRYESDSAAAGVDTIQHGVQQIIGNCPD